MNLTLFHLTPGDLGTRPLYVLAPSATDALFAAQHFMPNVRKVEAVANNAYVDDLFPRFIEWKPPETEVHVEGNPPGA